jgi:hypothetical protein
MFEVIQGDINNLADSAVLFSRFMPPPSYPGYQQEIIGMYLTTDAVKFLEKMGARDNLPEKAKNLERQVKADMKKIHPDLTENVIQTFGMEISIASEEELLKWPNDIIFVGNYTLHRRCTDALKHSSHLYILTLEEQLEKKINLGEIIIPGMPNYRLSKDLKSDLIKSYIGPLFHAVKNEDEKEIKRITDNLYIFSLGAPFITEIPNLISAIKSQENPNRKKIVELSLDKIIAIRAEDYEGAATIKKEMESLK